MSRCHRKRVTCINWCLVCAEAFDAKRVAAYCSPRCRQIAHRVYHGQSDGPTNFERCHWTLYQRVCLWHASGFQRDWREWCERRRAGGAGPAPP